MMNHPNPNVIYFHTFPRSGSHWFRYCFEFITKRKSERLQDENIIWTKETGASYPRALYHSHDPWRPYRTEMVGAIQDSSSKNITIIRNYREAILSEFVNKLRTISRYPARLRITEPSTAASDEYM